MSDAKTTTECCGAVIQADQRFCPKCGWEARTVAPPLTAGPVASSPDVDLRAIKARMEASSPLPWRLVVRQSEDPNEDDERYIRFNERGPYGEEDSSLLNKPNAEFFLHAREDIAALLAEIERLGEAPRGAARPPQPPDVFASVQNALNECNDWCASRDLNAVELICESVMPALEAVLKMSRPPASPPALEALIAKWRLKAEDGRKYETLSAIAAADVLEFCAEGLERALAVPPEAPPR